MLGKGWIIAYRHELAYLAATGITLTVDRWQPGLAFVVQFAIVIAHSFLFNFHLAAMIIHQHVDVEVTSQLPAGVGQGDVSVDFRAGMVVHLDFHDYVAVIEIFIQVFGKVVDFTTSLIINNFIRCVIQLLQENVHYTGRVYFNIVWMTCKI